MNGSLTHFPLSEIIGIVACLFGSAFFSGAETALTHLPETRARQLIDSDPSRYGILTFWLETKKRILAVLLVGNNLVNILCSVLAYRAALHFLPNYAEALSVFGLTIIILVFAEITPKSLALHYAQQVAVPILRLVWIIDKLLWIVAAPLTRIPDLILRRSGRLTDELSITEDEIEYQIRLGHDQDVFEEEAQGDLLVSAVEFSEIAVKEVMIPRTEIFGLEVTTSIEASVDAVIESGHSRIPVYRENLDHIVGLLHAKDLFRRLPSRTDQSVSNIESVIRTPPMFAPETQKISTLLAQMRKRGKHMAIVVDEFGGTSGLITLEDIIEELVGEIRDEFDPEKAPIHQIDTDTWIVDAHVSINDFKDATGIEIPNSSDYESVGGFVIAEHGRIPIVGTVIALGNVQTKVLVSDARHVERLEIKRVPEAAAPEDATHA
ncbi:MAG: hemolysin family protein [Myxococcota bacterium]|nr:hemolysin family protein [Myxococcota bacterium]